MDIKEREYELARLRDIVAQIERQLNASGTQCSASQQQLHGTLQNYWENKGSSAVDEAQMIEEVGRQKQLAALAQQQYKRLQRMADSPYFGRIDFWESGTGPEDTERIYTGIATLTEAATGEILIYDWRSPVAGMFYDFERGNAWYECPAGKIQGTILLKRQFKIVNGKMKYMFDADIKIEDELLQQVLSKSADDKMHTIVTSIQREQNRIVRDEGHRVLIVQGPAGCGKTSIALHRIAYLLYRERETISAKNVVIFSPNHIFSDYISQVLPEIGEENVLQTTFQDYMRASVAGGGYEVEERSEQLEYLLHGPQDEEYQVKVRSIQYKSSTEFVRLLDFYIEYLQQRMVEDYPVIRFRGRMIFSKGDWRRQYCDQLTYLPMRRRLQKIRKIIQSRMRPVVQWLREEKIKEITAAGNEVNARTIEALARIAARNELAPVTEKIEKLTECNVFTLYQRMFTEDDFFAVYGRGLKEPEDWLRIRQQTGRWLARGRIPYEDSFSFLYLLGLAEGFKANPDIKHVAVDEAQDYTILQYKIMKAIFPHSSWTLLGDPAQSVHPYLQTATFKAAAKIIRFEEEPVVFSLTRSYRSTCQIQKFCQALLGAEGAEPVNRAGPKPDVVHLPAGQDDREELLAAIRSCQREGWQSIALICKTAEQAGSLYEIIHGECKASVILAEEGAFRLGVIIIPAYLAKGLEFDAVVVIDASEENFHRPEEKGLFYTVCTRALHRLCLLVRGRMTPYMKDLDQALYTYHQRDAGNGSGQSGKRKEVYHD